MVVGIVGQRKGTIPEKNSLVLCTVCYYTIKLMKGIMLLATLTSKVHI